MDSGPLCNQRIFFHNCKKIDAKNLRSMLQIGPFPYRAKHFQTKVMSFSLRDNNVGRRRFFPTKFRLIRYYVTNVILCVIL